MRRKAHQQLRQVVGGGESQLLIVGMDASLASMSAALDPIRDAES